LSNEYPRFCKFCGEPVEFLTDFQDFYCKYCNSYQTKSTPIHAKGKKAETLKTSIDSSPPPLQRPHLPPEWQDNIPIFRHSQYLVVQAILSFGPKYTIYNVSGLKMGECQGKILSWGGEFDFYDNNGQHVAKVKGSPTLLSFQTKTWTITDYRGFTKGLIKSHFGFFKRNWELYDERGSLVARPNEQVWFKYNWQAVSPRGQILVSVDKKLFTFRDKFSIIVSPEIDPLIALAYAIAIDYMYFQGNK